MVYHKQARVCFVLTLLIFGWIQYLIRPIQPEADTKDTAYLAPIYQNRWQANPIIHNSKPAKQMELSRINCSTLPEPRIMEPGQLPLTSLSSIPGSGNTWVRILLSSLTGVTTGDLYGDGYFKNIPGFSRVNDDRVVVVKSHEHFFKKNFTIMELSSFQRYIVICRHPMDVAIAYFNYARTNSHTNTAQLTQFVQSGTITKLWRRQLSSTLESWLRFMRYFLVYTKKDVFMIFYENLKTELREEMVRVNEFIGPPLDQRRLNCLLDEQEQTNQQRFLRKERIVASQVVDGEMVENIQQTVDKFREMFERRFNSTGRTVPPYYTKESLTHILSQSPAIVL